LLDDIRDNVPKKAKGHFEMLQSRYERLVFLSQCGDKWDEMTIDEKSRVLSEIVYIEMSKHDNTQE